MARVKKNGRKSLDFARDILLKRDRELSKATQEDKLGTSDLPPTRLLRSGIVPRFSAQNISIDGSKATEQNHALYPIRLNKSIEPGMRDISPKPKRKPKDTPNPQPEAKIKRKRKKLASKARRRLRQGKQPKIDTGPIERMLARQHISDGIQPSHPRNRLKKLSTAMARMKVVEDSSRHGEMDVDTT